MSRLLALAYAEVRQQTLSVTTSQKTRRRSTAAEMLPKLFNIPKETRRVQSHRGETVNTGEPFVN